MRCDCLKDSLFDEAIEQLEREGKTLPQIRYTTEWNGTEWVTTSAKVE